MMIRKAIVVVVLSLFALEAFAQSPYTSRLGRFQVDQIKGCAPFTVTITTANLITVGQCTGGNTCLMDYQGNGQSQQNLFTFVYNTPGTYKLSVLYQSITPGADDITITVVANTQPDFEIYSCSGNGVSVKVNDNKYQQYLIDFNNDGIAESTQPFTNSIVAQHNYGAAGNYTIAVRGRNVNAADNCTPNRQTFTAIATLPTPTFTALTATDATSLKLDFPAQSHINLKSEIAINNAATFQQHQNLYGLTTSTATSLRVDDNYYCFRLNNFDPCTNTNRYSQVMCSHNFDLSIQSAVNRLAWTTGSSGATNITVQRNAQNYSTIPGTPLSFNDIDVVCKTNYCYKLVTNYPGGGRSTSLEKCGVSFTTTVLPTLDNISSVVGASQGVDISWNVAPAINTPQFNLFRSGLGRPYSLLTTGSTTKVADPAYVTEEIYCYRIDYTDACGNASAEGTPFCPIRLAGSLGDKNIAELSWSEYNGWKDGVSRYVVEKYTKAGALIGTVDNGTSLTYKDDPADTKNQAIVYVIKAYSSVTGVTVSSSNHVQIIKNTNLFAPTAFTPNGDALNDSFVVTGQYITKLTLKIFDRWGALIFTTEKNEPWNGTRSGTGQPVPEGTYIWKAEMTDESGKIFSEDGTVLVIRKSN